ncbi:MAG: hypothetical protein H6707_19325 [Deltaproteobacteria bacterium]|nr:hypothetical protein [Deltaproteobacteria bacterium]
MNLRNLAAVLMLLTGGSDAFAAFDLHLKSATATATGPNQVEYTVTIEAKSGTVDVSASAFNELDFSVGIWLNGGPSSATPCNKNINPAPDQRGTVTLKETLTAGNSKTLSFTVNNHKTGTFSAPLVWLNFDCGLAGYSSESPGANTSAIGDNGATISGGLTVSGATIPEPDLDTTITAATLSGSTVKFEFSVCNKGDADVSKSFTVALWYDSGAILPKAAGSNCGTLGTQPDQKSTITSLAKGACQDVTLSATVDQIKRASIRPGVLADWDCEIKESDETNNGSVRLLPLNLPWARLAISDFTVDSASDPLVTAKVTVRNGGASKADAVQVRLFVDAQNTPSCSASGSLDELLGEIASGNAKTANFSTTLENGDHELAVVACGSGGLDTAVERKTVSIGKGTQPTTGPDLYVDVFGAVVDGATATFSARVCANQLASGPFTIGIYYDSPDQIVCGQRAADETKELDKLDANCSEVTFVRGIASSGTYRALVLIDPQCALGTNERNKNNNSGTTTYVVGDGGKGGGGGGCTVGGSPALTSVFFLLLLLGRRRTRYR